MYYARNQLARATPAQLLSGVGAVYGMGQSFWQWYNSLTPTEQAAVQHSTRYALNRTGTALAAGARYIGGAISRRTNRTRTRQAQQAERRGRTLALARRPASLGRSRALTPARSPSRARSQSITRYFPRRVQPQIDAGTGTSLTPYRGVTNLTTEQFYDYVADPVAFKQEHPNTTLTGDGRLVLMGEGPKGNAFQTAYPRYIRDPTSYRKARRAVRKYLRRSKKSISY